MSAWFLRNIKNLKVLNEETDQIRSLILKSDDGNNTFLGPVLGDGQRVVLGRGSEMRKFDLNAHGLVCLVRKLQCFDCVSTKSSCL